MKFKIMAGTLLSLFLVSGMASAAEGNQVTDRPAAVCQSGAAAIEKGQASVRQNVWMLAKGTVIPVEAVASVSSKDCRKDQKVFFKLTKDVKSDEKVIISANTIVEATVTKVRRAGPWDRSGEIDLGFSDIKAEDGQSVPVEGRLEVKGKTPNFLVRYALLGVLIRGKNVQVGKGTAVDLKVADDVAFSESKGSIAENTIGNKAENDADAEIRKQ